MRNEKKITQTELGLMLGVNTSSIQKYESGATKNLKLDTLRELCYIFEVPPVTFVFPESVEKRDPNLIKYFLKNQYSFNDEGLKNIIEYIENMSQLEKYRNDRT